MKPPDLPLGRRESPRLEFKGADALGDLSTIGREVVAMLNGEGGEIWVGIEEENGRAARAVDVGGGDKQRRRVLDYLIDAIEPSPRDEEVVIETCTLPDEGDLLYAKVEPAEGRRPYALLTRSSRLFLIRVGDRNRPMSREEIAGLFESARPGLADDPLADVESEMLEGRRAAHKRGEELFWLCLRSVKPVKLDIQDKRVEELLRFADRTGNRASGWTFVNPYRSPQLEQEKLVFNGVEIHRDGTLTFELPLTGLHWKGEENDIYPFALMEFPVSAFRIANGIYSSVLEPADRVLADFALFGVEGWTLRPYSPRAFGHIKERVPFRESSDLVWGKPLVFQFEEISRSADWCAYRLAIRRTYEAFGYREDEIPAEFDRNAKKLVIDG